MSLLMYRVAAAATSANLNAFLIAKPLLVSDLPEYLFKGQAHTRQPPHRRRGRSKKNGIVGIRSYLFCVHPGQPALALGLLFGRGGGSHLQIDEGVLFRRKVRDDSLLSFFFAPSDFSPAPISISHTGSPLPRLADSILGGNTPGA